MCCRHGLATHAIRRTRKRVVLRSERTRESFFALRSQSEAAYGCSRAAAAAVVAFFRDSSAGSSRARAHTYDVAGSRFHVESYYTRGERGRKNKNGVVADEKKGKGSPHI